MGKDTEHQEFAYGSQDAAVNDAHWRKQEASYDEQEANCKSQVEDSHSEGALRVPIALRAFQGAYGSVPRALRAFQVVPDGFKGFQEVPDGFRRTRAAGFWNAR